MMDDCITTTVLMPGEYGFSNGKTRYQTLLGSCVAIIAWHPQKHIGGMCHYILPSRGEHSILDPRYANEFIQLLLRDIQLRGTRHQDYQLRLIGAANMFSKLKATCADSGNYKARCCDQCTSISCRNRLAAISETAKYHFNVVEADLGGTDYRFVEFWVDSGMIRVRKAPHVTGWNSTVS